MSVHRNSPYLSYTSPGRASLDEFFTNTDALILFFNPETLEIERASRAAEEFYGWPSGELIGKKITEIDVREEKEVCDDIQKTLVLHQLHFFLRHRKANGTIADMEVFTGRLPYREHPMLYAAMIDITGKKRNEDRQRRLAFEITRIEERERKQFASYLHDEIGQNLAILKMKLDVTAQSFPALFSLDEFKQINNLLDATIQQTRSVVFDLSPPLLYKLGLPSALCREGKSICQKNGLKFIFNNDKVPELSDDRKILIFRCVQELMRNCVEHAKASSMELSLKSEDAHIVLNIADDGIGFDAESLDTYEYRGFGLFSIKERLQAIGGALIIKSKRGKGTWIELVAPTD